jgi:hypothetical protein
LEKLVDTKKFRPAATNLLDHGAVFRNAVAKALVGHVEEGGELFGLDQAAITLSQSGRV